MGESERVWDIERGELLERIQNCILLNEEYQRAFQRYLKHFFYSWTLSATCLIDVVINQQYFDIFFCDVRSIEVCDRECEVV